MYTPKNEHECLDMLYLQLSRLERIHLCVILKKMILQRQKNDPWLPGIGSEGRD